MSGPGRRGKRTAPTPGGAAGVGLRCCASDGALLVAGGEGGRLHLWDVASMTGRARPGAGGLGLLPGPEGWYPPLACESRAPVNAVAVLAPPGGGGRCFVAAAQDDGALALFEA
ncbi:hypothetical protein Rsub_05370 [Raphidocelis subcapitata]|uniref:Uncharacterized protein n=1 Tax=Raphidocelis subcapitata TaxID=307507 RepID=A0A2V0P524_9CHLO|nr:hypothetical protein Rsub_05370 [Raphidocelis subcapitata]|eukprot:GBF92287.1 hypothetical protein Rsub_05370 [Raphidocelis subcapitata]